jgi:pectate lyase
MHRTRIILSTIGLIVVVIAAVIIGSELQAKQAKAASPDFSLVGYATVNGNTTGGASGATVTATSLSQLESYASSSSPLTINVSGSFTGSGNVTVASNKTILGVGTASLTGIGLSITGSTQNVIIRNLTISKVTASSGTGDAIHIQGTGVNHIWIDHNNLSSDTSNGKDYYDGLIDITHGADYITCM